MKNSEKILKKLFESSVDLRELKTPRILEMDVIKNAMRFEYFDEVVCKECLFQEKYLKRFRDL